MRIDKSFEKFLYKNAEFNEDGLLISLKEVNDGLIKAIDEEFIIPLHDELVDRRDIFNKQHPNEWFDKTCTCFVKDWEERKERLMDPKYGVLNYIIEHATKFYDKNIMDQAENDLLTFRGYIRDKRNESFEDKKKGIYGFRPARQFYKKIALGKKELKVGGRKIICRVKRINNEILFLRDEGSKLVDIEVGKKSGKDIVWTENGNVIMKVEIDPIFNAIYKDFKDNPNGLTTTQLLNESKSYGSYKRKISDNDEDALSQKNVTDYISRLNKELQNKGVPLEYRINRSGNIRFIPYLKLMYKQ